MDFKKLWWVNVASLIVKYVPLQLGMLIMEEAIHIWGQQHISIPSSLFCCELKTALKNNFFVLLYKIVQFSRSVVSNSLWPHELQHTRPPYPSPTSGVHSNSRPTSQWCHPAISSSVIAFSSCPQSLPASESFPMSQLFAWGGESIGVSASVSVLPKNTQDWSPL